MFCAVWSCLLFGCRMPEKQEEIDFSAKEPLHAERNETVPQTSELVIAVAPMISAQESYSLYGEMIKHLQAKCLRPLKSVYCKKYADVYRLFKSGEADFGFLCSGLYVIGKRNKLMELLAMPVINGNPAFQAYVIVPSSSAARQFSDLAEKSFAFTDELSLTGYFYPLSRSLAQHRVWSTTMFSGSHDNSIGLVNRGVVDGASVSSMVYDYVQREHPEMTKGVRILEKSQLFASPPVVVSSRIDPAAKKGVLAAFLSLDQDSAGKELLRSLGIDKFITGDDRLYASVYSVVPSTVAP